MAISVNIDGSWEELGHVEPSSLEILHEPYEYYLPPDPYDSDYTLSFLSQFKSQTISIPVTQVGMSALKAAMGFQALGDAFKQCKDDTPLWEQG